MAEPLTGINVDGIYRVVEGPETTGLEICRPTTVYAVMQAMGLVNDHAQDCVFREKVERARSRFRRPGRTP